MEKRQHSRRMGMSGVRADKSDDFFVLQGLRAIQVVYKVRRQCTKFIKYHAII